MRAGYESDTLPDNLEPTLVPNIPWTELPLTDAAMTAAGLDAPMREIVRHYAECGYAIIDPEIPESTIDSAMSAVRGLCFDERGELVRNRITDGWKSIPAVRDIAVSRKVIDILRALYQREPIPFQTLNFPVGTQQKTHSDTIHFSSFPPGFMCGVWLALEDVDEANGPLHYYSGSHRLPTFEMYDIGKSGVLAPGEDSHGADHYGRYEEFIEYYINNQPGIERREVHLKKGQALIWSANLFHGGNPILDPARTRFSQVTHFYFNDCMYYTPLLSDSYIGRFYLRDIADIRSGVRVPNVFNGKPLPLKASGLHTISPLGDTLIPVSRERSFFKRLAETAYRMLKPGKR
ncbi:MAG: phytanoyl-CoA dioxygenase family protein [Bacteroidota bacterium]